MSRRFAGRSSYSYNLMARQNKIGRSGLTPSEWAEKYTRIRKRQLKYVSSGICKNINCPYFAVFWETIEDCSLTIDDFLALCTIENEKSNKANKPDSAEP